MLLVVVLCTAATFWFVSERTSERTITEAVDQSLEQTEQAATETIVTAIKAVDRATNAVAHAQRMNDDAEHTMFVALQLTPDLSGSYIAGEDGSFLFVFRTEDGYGTKAIAPATHTSERQVVFTERDSDFVITREWSDDTDSYDPRTRPWFELATAAPGAPVWTDAYTFFTSGRPGITHAVSDPLQRLVIGVDVELQSLVKLLDELSTSTEGEVFLTNGTTAALTRDGLIDLTAPAEPTNGRLLQAMTALEGELGGHTASHTHVEYEYSGEKHIAGLVTLGLADNTNWTLVTDIAASDIPDLTGNLVRTMQLLGLAIGAAAICAIATLAIQGTRSINDLERQTLVDQLTALPNRRAITHAGERAKSSGSLRAVAMIDVDHFKAVNDTHGHPVGDEVLQGLAMTFEQAGCEIGRVGGEEFVMLIKDEDNATATRVELLRAAVALSPVETSAGPVSVSISIGLAFSGPDQTFAQTLRCADDALLAAKTTGRNRVVVVGKSVDHRLSYDIVKTANAAKPAELAMRDLVGSSL